MVVMVSNCAFVCEYYKINRYDILEWKREVVANIYMFEDMYKLTYA